MPQSMPAPPGSASSSVTSNAVPGPSSLEFSTSMEKPIISPALTRSSSASLSTLMSGHWTSTVALLELFEVAVSPSALTVAVLVMVRSQSVSVVSAASVIVRVSSAPRGPKLQFSVLPPATSSPAASGVGSRPIQQSPMSAPPTVQVNPAGSESLSVTSLAVPSVPASTVIEKLAVSVLLITGSVEVFSTDTSGQSTCTLTVSLLFSRSSSDSLSAATLAVFVRSSAHAVDGTLTVIVTLAVAPAARSPSSHSMTLPADTVHEPSVDPSSPRSYSTVPMIDRSSSRSSLMTAFSATPSPSLLTKMTYSRVSGARTVRLDADLSSDRSGHSTVMLAESLLLVSSTSSSAVISAVFAIPSAQSSGELSVVIVIVRVSPFAMSPKSQVSVSPGMISRSAQSPASSPVMVQVRPLSAGFSSVSTTFVELPLPPAVTTTSKAASPPASIVALTASFTTDASGQSTVMVAVLVLFEATVSPATLIVAVLEMVAPHVSSVVVALSVIVLSSSAASAPKSQLRVAPPATVSPALRAGPPAEQSPMSAPPTVQVKPAGRTSLSVTADAVPSVPPLAVMLNDAVSPPMIVGAVAVLTTDASGQLTVTLTVLLALLPCSVAPSFVAETLEVLLTDGQAATGMSTVIEAVATSGSAPVVSPSDAARVPTLQEMTFPAPTVQLPVPPAVDRKSDV